MYTAPLLLATLGMAYLWNKSKGKGILKYLTLFFISITIIQQFIGAFSKSVRMAFTDTRVVALEYCTQSGIKPENTIYEGYTPFLPQYPSTIFSNDLSATENSIEYIILSSQMYQRYYGEADRYIDEVAYYEEIQQNHILVKEFSPDPNSTDLKDKLDDIVYYFLRYLKLTPQSRLTGPTVKIYKITSN